MLAHPCPRDGDAAPSTPHTTMRAWWRRFRAVAHVGDPLHGTGRVLLDGMAVTQTSSGKRAGLEVRQVAWQLRDGRLGEAVGQLRRFWSRISGGPALGTKTTSPWAGAAGTHESMP